MAEWWIYGHSLQRKKFPDGWIIFFEYIPKKGIYSLGMSKDVNERYQAYWTIFVKEGRSVAEKVFQILKQLKSQGKLDVYKPSGKEGLSKQDKLEIAQMIADKLRQPLKIVIEDKEYNISPKDAQASQPPFQDLTNSNGKNVNTSPQSAVQVPLTSMVGAEVSYPQYIQQEYIARRKTASKKKLFLFAGIAGAVILVIIFLLLKK